MLAGEGADRFAHSTALAPADLLTGESRAAWQKWLSEHAGARRADHLACVPPANIEEKRPLDELATSTNGTRTTPWACWPSMPPESWPAPAPPAARPSRCPGAWAIIPIIGHGLYVDPLA